MSNPCEVFKDTYVTLYDKDTKKNDQRTDRLEKLQEVLIQIQKSLKICTGLLCIVP